MPSRATVVRAKSTRSKGKVQPNPTDAVSSVSAQPPMPSHNGTHVQVTRPSVVRPSRSGSSQQSAQAQGAVTAQQSTEVVQTFLFSAVSTVLWMRDLLPDDYFRTAFYASINKHCSYHDFTHGSDDGVTAQGDRSRPKGYHLRVLKRNASARGDQIIQWLELGVFEAIKQGYLDQLQISIFAQDEQPTEVLELYCFHFQYSDQEDGSVAVDLEVEDMQNKTTVSLKDARGALNTVVKNMVGLNGTMPHLPERCFMSPYLVWNERRPAGYQPPGFHPSEEVNVSFPVTQGWSMETSTCGQVKTGFQSVNLGIAYTKGAAADDGDEAVVMPDFTYGEPFSRLDPFCIQSSTRNHQQDIPESIPQSLPTPRQSSAVGNDANLPTPTVQARRISDPIRDHETGIILPDNVGDMASTQDKGIASQLKAIRTIEPHQAFDTQLVFRPSSSTSRMGLRATTTQELHKQQGASGPPEKMMTQEHISSESVILSCECGTKETDNIIQCHNCDCWQHAQCYAYDGPNDARMPTEHSCYTCGLGNMADKHLGEIEKLARTRQIIHSIRVRGLNSIRQIAQTLGYKLAHVMELLRSLQHNDIVQVKNAKKATGHVVLTLSEESKQALMEMYLDPTKNVEKCVEDIASGWAGRNTPRRKRKASGSPDHDQRLKTPRLSRPRSNLPFDSNALYTPNGAGPFGRDLD